MRYQSRPREIYRNKWNERVPGVTTVLSQWGADREDLMGWAHYCGLEGIDYREERDHAASIGHIAHDAIDAEIRGLPFDLAELELTEIEIAAVTAALDGYRRWRDQTKLEIVSSELPMVSETHQFGGRPDVVSAWKKLAIVDWKTSNKLYRKNIAQVRAYAALWTELHPEQPIEEVHILRIGKRDAAFEHCSWEVKRLDPEWEIFLACLKLYKLDRETRKTRGLP